MFYINENIFFRIYDEEVFVADTKMDKYYIFNESMAEILSFLTKTPGVSMEALVEHFANTYKINSNEELYNDISIAVSELLNYKIIYDDFDIENFMTLKAAENKRLYHALIELTYKCNLKCKHCYAEAGSKEEMSTQQVKSVINQLYEMNVMYITFTGGEVFTRNDFIEIFDYAIEKGFVVEIFSNGVNISSDLIKYISKKYIKCFHCSIYSHIPDVHDSITGVKGSFEKTIDTLKKFKSLGTKINIKTVIMNDNKNDLEGLIDLSEKLNASLQVGLNVTPKNSGDLSPTQLRMNSIREYENVLRILNKSQNNHAELSKRPERYDDDNLCGAGLCSISINPYGEVFPCNGMTVKIGDVSESTIKDIWDKSKDLKEIRSKTFGCVDGCEECDVKSYCHFCMGQSFLENNGELRKYDEACMLANASYNIQEKNKERRKTNEKVCKAFNSCNRQWKQSYIIKSMP